MKAAVLYSGGKDSTYALYLARQAGWSVDALVTVKPENPESFMYHTPCLDLTTLQAEALGLPLKEVKVSGVKEKEVEELELALKKFNLNVDALVSGAVESEYQRSRIAGVCDRLGLESITPLWQKNPEQLMNEILEAGFEIIISAVAAEGLDERWVGRKLDEAALEDLKGLSKVHGIHIAGEGGEYETLVVGGPTFKQKLKLARTRVEWDGTSGRLMVEDAGLV